MAQDIQVRKALLSMHESLTKTAKKSEQSLTEFKSLSSQLSTQLARDPAASESATNKHMSQFKRIIAAKLGHQMSANEDQ